MVGQAHFDFIGVYSSAASEEALRWSSPRSAVALKASYTPRACLLLSLSSVAVPALESTTSESSETGSVFKDH